MESLAARPIRAAVVGYGYWGPNIVRNVLERSEFELVALCETDATRAEGFRRRHPGIRVVHDFDTLLADETIEAVSIATPPSTHHPLVKKALLAGKHVLVEKPLATTEQEARELIEIAGRVDRTLMPGHTFLYSPPVNKVRELLDDGVLGEVYFVTSSRMNLGIYQADGVVRDLAPHDLSILLYWLNEPIVQVTASGRSVFQRDVPETAFLTLTFAGGASANIQISWLAPRKVRQMIVVGSRRMVQYEDTSADEAVRIYDRGLDLHQPENFGEYRMIYRSGDMVAPKIEPQEPLALELADFARAIRTGEEPRSNARLGLQIVQVLEAAEQSLRRQGQPTILGLDLDEEVANADLASNDRNDDNRNGGAAVIDEAALPARVAESVGLRPAPADLLQAASNRNGRRPFTRWLARRSETIR